MRLVVFLLMSVVFISLPCLNKPVFSKPDNTIKISKDISILGIIFGSSKETVLKVMASRGAERQTTNDLANRERYTGVNLGKLPTRSFYFLFTNEDTLYTAVAVIEETSNYYICDKKFSEISKILYKKYQTPTESVNKYFMFKGNRLIEKARVWYCLNISNLKKFLIALVLRPYDNTETADDWLSSIYELADDDDSLNGTSTDTIEEDSTRSPFRAEKIRLELSYQDVNLYNQYNDWLDQKIIEDF